MLNLKKDDKKSELEKEYENAVKLLRTCTPNTSDYDAQLKVVERFHEMLMAEESYKRKVSPDAIIAGAVGVFQVGAILWHERAHNVLTKALQFVIKGRVR